MEPEISVKFKLTEDELVRLIREQVFGHWVIRLFTIIVVGNLILIAFVGISRGILPNDSTLVPLIGLSLVLIGAYFAPILYARGMRKRSIFNEFIWYFSEPRVRVQSGGIFSRYQWIFFERAKEDKNFYSLYFSRKILTDNPKQVFASPQEEALFKQILSTSTFPVYITKRAFESKEQEVEFRKIIGSKLLCNFK